MTFLERIKYRWKYEYDPLEELPEVIMYSMGEDKEKRKVLRKLRALLFGYGEGWTFKAALLNVVSGGLL